MKTIFLLATLIATSLNVSGQLYAPSGVITGSSGNQNVGVGTATPGARLHVKSDGTNSAWLALEKNSSSEEGGIQFKKNGSVLYYFYSDNMTTDDLKLQSAGTAGEGDGTPRIHIPYSSPNLYLAMSGGNVGIGTSTPGEKLDVNGRIISRMTNGGGWDFAFGAAEGGGLLIGPINVNSANTADRAHILYRNLNGGIYYGYNNTGTITTQINSQGSGHSFFNSGGNVGIGTSSPASTFHVSTIDASVQQRFQRTGSGAGITDVGTDDQGYKVWVGGYSSPSLKVIYGANGRVGIGTFSPDATLAVKGTIHAEEVKVDLSVPGPDYVFEKDYNLMSLEEIKAFIEKNKHLPEVPSAKEMETNGVNLSEMNMILLKKVEELTLHVIELKKENEAQTKRADLLDDRIKKLTKQK